MRLISDYLNLLAGEHRGKPKYEATIELLTAPLVALQQFLLTLPGAFDLDDAIGAQLDIDGIWIGRSRNIQIPLPDVFFSFDTVNLGFDQGVWFGPFTPTQGLGSFDDNTYRALLRTKIICNSWDGTALEMQQALQLILNPYPDTILGVIDNYDGSMTLALAGKMPPRLIFYLVTGNYVPFKTEGVQLYVLITSVESTPLFGLDVETNFISGLDVGAWGVDPSFVPSLPVITPIQGGVSINILASVRVQSHVVVTASSAQTGRASVTANANLLGSQGAAFEGRATLNSVGATKSIGQLITPQSVNMISSIGRVIARLTSLGNTSISATGSVATTSAVFRQGQAKISGAATISVPVTESPDGTQVVAVNQAILASQTPGSAAPLNGPFDTFEISTSGSVMKNGSTTATGATSGVIGLYYGGHYIYQVASNGNELGFTPGWWRYDGGTTWTAVAPPIGETIEGTIGISQ